MESEIVRAPQNPVTLSDLMLAAPLRRRINLISLTPRHDHYHLVALRGGLVVVELPISFASGAAAAGRLAWMAHIDPFIPAEDGVAHAARLKVRAGEDEGELLITIGPSEEGLTAEVRPIAVNGRLLEQPAHGHLKRCVRCAAFQSPERARCEVDDGELIDIADDPRPGGTIGVYRLGRQLGDGGMATVLAGEHAIIGRPVAVKIPHASITKDPDMVRRFLAEARAVARLRHPNIVDVTDYGIADDGRPYMVMELLHGETLRDRLERDGVMPLDVALVISRELAVALAAAHEGGVLHLDMKPENAFLLEGSTDEMMRLKLVDFGASLRRGEDGLGYIVGTPAYMAPEYSRGEPADERTDLYALGIVLYEMLIGAPPFDGPSSTEVRVAHMTQPVPMPPPGQMGFTPLVRRIVERALRKLPSFRYPSARAMLADIDEALAVARRDEWRRWAESSALRSANP